MLTNFLISSLTNFRNPNGTEYEWTLKECEEREPVNCIKASLAEIGYLAIIPFAIIESALSCVAHFFASILDFTMDIFVERLEISKLTSVWAKNSLFAVGWSAANSVLNLFCNDLLVYASNAYACVKQGNLQAAPTPLARRDRHIDLRCLI